MRKLLPTEKSAALKLALRLSWVSFWPTALYGTVFVVPFAVVLSFAGRGVMSTACVLFLAAISWSFLLGLKCFYMESLRGAKEKPFREALLPLVLGKQPAKEAWKEDGSPGLGLIWPLLRERLTGFCFAALVGSIIVIALREPVAAFLYLPCWFIADVMMFRQLLTRRLTFKHEFSAPLFDGALSVFADRPKVEPLRFVKKAVIMPVLFAAVWWTGIPVVTGALSFGPSADVVKFIEEGTDTPAGKNGIYALLGLDAEGDVFAHGEEIARKLKRGETPATVQFTETSEIACRAADVRLSDADRAALEKYDALSSYEVFYWPNDLLKQSGIAYVDVYLGGFAALARLKTHAVVRQALEGDREGALTEWVRHTAFLDRLTRARLTLLEFALLREKHAEAMRVLPCIIQDDAAFAKKRAADIRAAFTALKPKDLPLREIVDNETRIMGLSAERQVQAIFDDLSKRAPMALKGIFMDIARLSFRRGPDVLQTKIYWLMREMHQLIDEFHGDIADAHERLGKLADRYAVRNGRLLISVSDMLGPQVGAIANIILSEMPEAYKQLFFNPDEYDMQRMLLAYAEALGAVGGMSVFLENTTDPVLRSLVKGEAFVWDAETARICRKQEEEAKEDSHNSEAGHLCLDTRPFVE